MKYSKDDWFWIILFSIIILGSTYAVWVDTTATRKAGCSYWTNECTSSHIEKSERYYAKSWHTEETEVCDDYDIVEVPCDCVTYHWFWGDYKNYK
jgi:hypothetical protein